MASALVPAISLAGHHDTEAGVEAGAGTAVSLRVLYMESFLLHDFISLALTLPPWSPGFIVQPHPPMSWLLLAGLLLSFRHSTLGSVCHPFSVKNPSSQTGRL